MTSLTEKKVIFRAGSGSTIYDCKVEAALVALQDRCTVGFLHNDKTYVVSVGTLVDCVREGFIEAK